MRHLWEFILFSMILFAPLPVCAALLFTAEEPKENRGFAHRLLVILTAWCITQTCVGLLLGIVHQLHLGAVLALEATLLLVGILCCANGQRLKPSHSWRDLLKWRQPFDAYETLMLGVISLLGTALLWRLTTRPTTDYDSLMYHLPMMAKWYQTSSLKMVEELVPYTTYFYNWEVLCALFLLPFREDFLVMLPNLIAWVTLGLAVYCLSTQIGATRTYSLAMASLVMTLPILIAHVNTMHVDLPFAAFFAACAYFAVVYHRTRSFPYLALVLAAVGMSVGIKVPGIAYGILQIVALAAMIVLRRKSVGVAPPSRYAVPLGVVCFVCFTLLGGFWYVRNFVELGNPLGYFRVQVAGVTIFPGTLSISEIRRATSLANVFEPTNAEHWKILRSQTLSALHLPFFVMAACALCAAGALRSRRNHIKTEYLLTTLALLVGTGLLYGMTPYTAKDAHQTAMTSWMGTQFRFAFPFLSLLGVTAAAGATVLQLPRGVMVAPVFISGFLGIYRTVESLKILVLTVALVAAWQWFAASRPRKRERLAARPVNLPRWATVALCALLIGGGTFIARKKRDVQRHQVYGDVVAYTTDHLRPDDTIGYLASHRSYLFYGKEFNRKVVYAPSPSDDLTEWLNDLRQQKVRVVAVGPGPIPEAWKTIADMQTSLANRDQNVVKELFWLEDPNGAFVRVCGRSPNREPLLYRFKKT